MSTTLEDDQTRDGDGLNIRGLSANVRFGGLAEHNVLLDVAADPGKLKSLVEDRLP